MLVFGVSAPPAHRLGLGLRLGLRFRVEVRVRAQVRVRVEVRIRVQVRVEVRVRADIDSCGTDPAWSSCSLGQELCPP